MPYLLEVLKMVAFAALVALGTAHFLAPLDAALAGVVVLWLLVVRAS